MVLSTRKNVRLDRGLRAVLAIGLSAFSVSCSAIPPPPQISPPTNFFSDPVARAHLRALAGIGPRWPGDAADEMARQYLRREFESSGGKVRSLDAQGRNHILVEIPGRSEASLLLVSPLQALGSTDWVDDSGPALFLELVRVLAADVPAYTLRFALSATGPSPAAPGDESKQRIPEDPIEARRLVFEAGQSLVEALRAEGKLDRVRVIVVLEPRASSRPRIDGDLRSHPVFRKIFWSAAADLGETAAFPIEPGWSSPLGLQSVFYESGLDQVVALIDETSARTELLSEAVSTRLARSGGGAAPDRVQTDGLSPIGRVTLEALGRLIKRFEKVDAFFE